MTQLRQALRAVGLMTVEERLREMAISILTVHANNREEAARAFYAKVKNDADLLGGLFEPYRDLALKRLLGAVESEMRREELARQKAQGGGLPPHDSQNFGAAAERPGGGQLWNETRMGLAPAAPPPDRRQAQEAVANVMRLTMLDTFQIYGTPIGDMQAGAARAWAHHEGRHVRWVTMITANLPAHDVIRRWVTPDDADELWARSLEGDDA